MNSTSATSAPFSGLQFLQPAGDLEAPPLSGTDRLRNIFGIPVAIENDRDEIVVTDYIVHMYGVGNSIQEAIDDYKISIKAYFEELQEDENRLGSDLTRHLCYLRNIFMSFE